MHYVLDFGVLASNLILLRHDSPAASSVYQVVDAEEWATPHHLLSLAGWGTLLDHLLPDISWGSSSLAIDDVLQMRTGMILTFRSVSEADDEVTLLQTWFATDRLHGRSVGLNGFQHLPPPGNGPRVSFSARIWIVDDVTKTFKCIKDNPFLEELYEDLHPDEDYEPNDFQADFRFWSDKEAFAEQMETTFVSNFVHMLEIEAFRNPFAGDFMSSYHDACEKSEFETEANNDSAVDEISTASESVADTGTLKVNCLGSPLVLQLAECISDFGVPLTQTYPFSDGVEGVDFRKVYDMLLWFDAHVSTPCYIEPNEVQWHESSLPWLVLDWWLDEPVSEMHFYTDGSQRTCGGGLASVLFVKTIDGYWKFGGYKAVKTKLHGSYAAELSALLVTYKWIYDLGRFQVVLPEQVEVHFDSTSAGFRATGHWQGSTYTSTVVCLRALAFLIDERFRCTIEGSHIKAHYGNGGNEMANSLAYWAAEYSDEEIDTCLHSCCEGLFDLEMEWIFFLFKTELAPFWHEGHLQLPARPSTPSMDICPDDWNSGLHPPEENEGCARMKISSANVLTLLPGQDTEVGLLDSARQATILKQAQEAGVHILSLQETRLRKSLFRSTPDFLIVQSAAHKGHGGIALCFNRKLPYGSQEDGSHHELFFRKEHFAIISSDPRWLIVRVKAPGLRCLILGLHAPQSGQSEAAIRGWWDALEMAIPQRYSDWQLIAAGDFNARCGTTPTVATGGHQGENENLNGELMQDWLIRRGMWAPSTWSFCQDGPPGTWQHPGTGRWSRLDYICLSSSMRCSRAWVDLDLTWHYVELTILQFQSSSPSIWRLWTQGFIIELFARLTMEHCKRT